MEEIEYLEEYEDLILPNAINCRDKLAVERPSMDSLEGLYKDLIGDSSSSLSGRASSIQFTTKSTADANQSPLLDTDEIGMLAQPIQNAECNLDSGSSTYLNKTNPSEVQQSLYESQTSHIFINRVTNKSFSTSSALQRSDKFKSVATVKPTLQRVNNPKKKSISYNSPPLKNAKVVQSFRPYSRVTPPSTDTKSGSKFAVNAAKSNTVQNKSTIKNQFQGSGVDPLSLDDNDGFLDFDDDVDKNVDDFDLESDLDNSITAGISDMDSDSVDLSDDYSDDNFDLESDLSSESSELKRGELFKRKKQQKSSLEQSKDKSQNRPGAAFRKSENKRDETNLSKSKVAQRIIEKTSIHSSFGRKKIHSTVIKPQIIGTKDCLNKSLPSKSNQMSPHGNVSMLSKLLNDSNDSLTRTPNTVSNSKQAAVVPYCKKIVVKKDDLAKNSNLKASPEKRESDKTNANIEKVKTISIESSPEDATKKLSPESLLSKLLKSSEQSNNKSTDSSDKSFRVKFGSFQLKSIKPPAGKSLMLKNMSPKSEMSSDQQQSEHSKQLLTSSPDGAVRCKVLQKSSAEEKDNAENKKTLSHDSKTASPNAEGIARPKSPAAFENDKSDHKSEAIDSSASKRNSLKANNYSSESFEKRSSDSLVEKPSTPSRSELKETKEIAPSSKCSVNQQLENTPKESSSFESTTKIKNSLKESVSKPKENTVEKKNKTRSQCKFKPRSFKIRLNRDIVTKHIRSASAVSTKSKAPNSSKVLIQDLERTLNRKMSSCPNVDVSPQITLPEVAHDNNISSKTAFSKATRPSTGSNKSKEPTTSKTSGDEPENLPKRKLPHYPHNDVTSKKSLSEGGQEKVPQADSLPEEIGKRSRIGSDIPSNKSKSQAEEEAKNPESTGEKSCPASRKRKRTKMKIEATPKVLRSTLKSMVQHSDLTNPDNSITESAVQNSHYSLNKDKHISKSQTTSTSVTESSLRITEEHISKTPSNKESSSLATPEECIQKSPRISANDNNSSSLLQEKSTKISPTIPPNSQCGDSNSNSTKNKRLKKRRKALTARTIKRRAALAARSRDISQANGDCALVVLTPLEDSLISTEKEPTQIETPPCLVAECMRSENVDPVTSERNDDIMNSAEVQIIQPKTELSENTLVMHYQSDLTINNTNGLNMQLFPRPQDTDPSFSAASNDSQNENEFTVFELPSYIVMKTKIVTRQELNSNKADIPPLVRQKMDKLAEGRQEAPVFKTERPDFKDVCLEINSLLGRNANYLKFASSSERQTRINQVLSDSSLSVVDAQCALKFLQSYLSLRTKDVTARPRGQQFIPIYDSQKKIIGYRKRTTHAKKAQSNESSRKNAPSRMSNVNTPAVPSVPSTTNPTIVNVCTISGISSADPIAEFAAKEEPLVVDGGDEEIIVPDASPSSEPCIKNEEDIVREIT